MKRILSVAAFVAFSCSATSFAQEFEEHTVKPGETCTSIAAEYYGDPHAYDYIHSHNDLSEYGYACREGITLKMAILPPSPDAKLVARAGQVRARSPQDEWAGVEVGAEFFEAWRVNTLDRARAELGFRDSTELQMTENTLVVIYGPGKAQTRKTTIGRATVERGRLKASLAGLSGAPIEVETPSGTVSMSKGKGQITVDEDGESRFANHTGPPLEVADKNGGNVSVKEGYGSRVKPGQNVEKPRPLPPTPAWSADFAPFGLTLGSSAGMVRAQWEKVSEADAYHVEVTRDERAIDVLVSQRVPANIDRVELRDLPPGDYFVSIVSIDAAKFESVPSRVRRLRVTALPIAPSAIVDADSRTVLIGEAPGSPDGLECDLDGSSESPGVATVRCSRNGATAALELNYIEPAIRLVEHETIVVQKGGIQTAEIEFDPAVPAGAKVVGPEGVEVKAVKVRTNALRVNLGASEDAAEGLSKLDVLINGRSISSLDIEILGRDAVVVTGSSRQVPIFVSGLVGYDAVGVAPYWSDGFPVPGATVELGFGALGSRYFGAELRLGYSAYNGDSGSESTLRVGANALAGMFDWEFAPYASVGIAWRSWLGERDRSSAQGALGAIWCLTDDWDLRGEVGVGISAEAGDVDALPEARAGVHYRF